MRAAGDAAQAALAAAEHATAAKAREARDAADAAGALKQVPWPKKKERKQLFGCFRIASRRTSTVSSRHL